MDDASAAITFENIPQPLDSIIKSSTLPTIIKYDQSQILESERLVDPGFDISQFHLLNSTHDIRRIHARTAVFQPHLKCVLDGGYDVSIGNNYEGWFAVFGNPNKKVNDLVVPHYRNIGKLCISSCHKFLVSGKISLEAMKVFRHADGQKSLAPHRIQPGTVLTKGNVYTVSLKIKIKKNVFRSKVVKKDETYMACWDELTNEELLVPCHTDGIFYVISQKTGDLKVPIMKVSEIVNSDRFHFPFLVKLIHGETIGLPRSCVPILTVLGTNQSKRVLVSTLYTPKTTLFTINTDSPLQFFKIVPNPDIRIDRIFSAVSLDCTENAPLMNSRMIFRLNEQISGIKPARASDRDVNLLQEQEVACDYSLRITDPDTPFIESLSPINNELSSYTHLSESPTCQKTQTQKQHIKEKRTKIETTAIKRNNMYELYMSKVNDSIPINRKRRDSEKSSKSANEMQHRLASTSPIDRGYNSEMDLTQAEYCQLWNDDTSSMTSGESLEVEVENVTVSGEQDHSAIHEYTNITAQLAATVRLKTQKRQSLTAVLAGKDDKREPDYEILANVTKSRNGSVYSFLALGQAPPPPVTVTSNSSPALRELAVSTSNKSQNNSYYNDRTRNSGNLYEQPTHTGETATFNKRGTYIEPHPPYYNDGFKGSIKYDTLHNNDDNYYETLCDCVYESIAEAKTPELQRKDEYMNIIETRGEYENIRRANQFDLVNKKQDTEDLSNKKGVRNHVMSSTHYVNNGSADTFGTCKDDILSKLIENMKTLCLKPGTEKMLKNIDTGRFEIDPEIDDFKTKLKELCPEMNKIDLNKISLYYETHQV